MKENIFIGREKELNYLESLYTSNRFEMLIVHGRRKFEERKFKMKSTEKPVIYSDTIRNILRLFETSLLCTCTSSQLKGG